MDYFCSLPFRSLMTFNTGGTKPCCDSDNLQSEGHQTLSEVWNSEKWKSLRKSFLNNEQNPICSVCWKKEASGFVSARKPDRSKAELNDCDPNGQMRSSPKQISLRLGNKCNLACIMCTPQNSSLWEKESHIYREFINKQTKPVELPSSSSREEYEQILKAAEVITFIGGEPLLFREHEEIIQFLINSKRAEQVELHYFTNMTVLPERLIGLWRQFKKIDLRSSIDGVGAEYEYIRFPAKWKTIEKNMLKLNQAGIEQLVHSMCFVLMNINVLQLEKLFEWRSQISWAGRKPIIRPDYLIEPDFLQPHILRKKEKDIALESFERTRQYCNLEEGKLISDMSVQILTEVKDQEQHLEKLRMYLLAIEKNRSQNAKEYWPWIFNLNGEYYGVTNCTT